MATVIQACNPIAWEVEAERLREGQFKVIVYYIACLDHLKPVSTLPLKNANYNNISLLTLC